MPRILQQHINDNYSELDSSTINSQRRRHLENEVEDLEKYQENHISSDYDLTSLELYCDLYPNALECRIYE
jgi:hypothetical protein